MSKLTVILAHKNRQHNLEFCLESINSSNKIPRVILVDFGSTIQPRYTYPWLQIIHVTHNTDFFQKARALNIGIRQTKTVNLCTTDVDQIFNKNFFSVVDNTLTTRKSVYVMCRTYVLRELPSTISPKNIMINFDKLLIEAKKIRKIPFGDGCCHGMPTYVAHALGGYDESSRLFAKT